MNKLSGLAAASLSVEPRLKAFGRPVDIVFGAEDRYLNTGVAQEFHRLFPHSELHLISHAAHYVQLDEPAEVAARILAVGSI
jgi:haloalkane dehalogenase